MLREFPRPLLLREERSTCLAILAVEGNLQLKMLREKHAPKAWREKAALVETCLVFRRSTENVLTKTEGRGGGAGAK